MGGDATSTPLEGTFYRLVESQEQIASRSLVNGDLQKQALLEEMLEPTKPPRIPGTEHLDYLLATPFRYPPLRHGSRYGKTYEPSLLYGGLSKSTTFAECAYYRWYFYFDMAEPPSSLSSQHTLFQANYLSSKGIALQHEPFVHDRAALTDKQDYRLTQALGTIMRDAGVEMFEYPSARDPHKGDNVALLTPQALSSDTPYNRASWLCSTDQHKVVYSYKGAPVEVYQFAINDFLLGGKFPTPA